MANGGVNSDTPMNQLNWTPAEKKIARTAFDRALHQELESLVQEVRERAAKIAQPSEMWDLEDFLTQRRREIDRKYDYRYSVLPEVFGYLIVEGCLTEDDLRGLGEDKLEFTRRLVAFAKH